MISKKEIIFISFSYCLFVVLIASALHIIYNEPLKVTCGCMQEDPLQDTNHYKYTLNENESIVINFNTFNDSKNLLSEKKYYAEIYFEANQLINLSLTNYTLSGKTFGFRASLVNSTTYSLMNYTNYDSLYLNNTYVKITNVFDVKNYLIYGYYQFEKLNRNYDYKRTWFDWCLESWIGNFTFSITINTLAFIGFIALKIKFRW